MPTTVRDSSLPQRSSATEPEVRGPIGSSRAYPRAVMRIPSVAAAIVLIVVAACTAPPGSGSAAALATPTEAATPTDAATRSPFVEPTRTPTLTSPPSPTASPRPRPTPSPIGPATPRPTPFDAALEAMLPHAVRGIPISTFSGPMAPFAGGGDMCILLCADEPGRLAAASGVSIDRMTLGLAIPPDDSGFAAGALAIRFKEVDARSLIGIRVQAGGHSTFGLGLPVKTVQLRVGARDVVWVLWPPFYEDRYGEYLLERGDVLFIVDGAPPAEDGTVSDDVALFIEAMP